MKRNPTPLIVFAVVALMVIGATTSRTPLNRAYLQSPLDGNTNSITNISSLSFSNGTSQSSAGLSTVTNGDSSISSSDSSGIVTLRATNITEAKMLISDNTTLDASSTKHGFVPKLVTPTNSLLVNIGATSTWQVVSNFLRAGSNVTLASTNGVVTIHAEAGGSGSSLGVNGTNVSSANFTNSATITYALSGSNITLTANTATVTESLQNKTIDAANNIIKMRNYLTLASPFNSDGAGATIVTNDNSLAYFGQAQFHATNAASANWVEYRLTVPEDIDTSVDLKLERFKFRLGGTDTNTQSYVLTQAAVADSASYDSPSLSQSVTLSSSADASGASGDVETISNVTLTNWAGNVTAGRLWVIRLARNGDTDGSTNASYSGPLVISYGITQ